MSDCQTATMLDTAISVSVPAKMAKIREKTIKHATVLCGKRTFK